MFGITTFAQAPFSTLAGAGSVFSVAVNETATGADTTSSILAFLANIDETTTGSAFAVLMFCQQSWPCFVSNRGLRC
jgi:hypothetical protein